MSLTCAASRNLTTANLDNGRFRRVTAISRGPLRLEVRTDRLLFSSVPASSVRHNALYYNPRLVASSLTDLCRLGPEVRSVQCSS